MNVHDLATLARGIKDALARQNSGRKEWIEASIDLCIRLSEARKRFVDHAEFGDWLKRNEIAMNEHNRAAAIAMADDRKRLRQVLENTERWSLRIIFEQEFKTPAPNPFGSPTKRVGKLAQPEPAKPEPAKRGRPAKVNYDERLKEAKAELKDKTKSEIDAKVEAKFAKLKAKLEAEYREKKAELSELTKRAMMRLNSLHGLVEKDDDTMIIKCLHPDHVASLGSEVVAMHEKGWRAYHKYRDYIIVKPPERLK